MAKFHSDRNKENLPTLDYTELIDRLKSGGIVDYAIITDWYRRQKARMGQKPGNVSGLTANTILCLTESFNLPLYEVYPNTYKLLTDKVLKQYERQSAEYWKQRNRHIEKYRSLEYGRSDSV